MKYIKRSFFVSKIALLAMCMCVLTAHSNEGVIEMAFGGEFFIIDGEDYKAETYCSDIRVGDSVVVYREMSDASASHCSSAVVTVRRTGKTCNVICR